jgi:hypothetical protein
MTEARAHHYVPQCWLLGFTDTGEKDGMLYVTDLKRKKQWRCKPSEVGHRRDFNRVDDPSVSDPNAIEKIFAEVESTVAPLFKTLCEEKRGPKDGDEFGLLVEYLAIQWIRVPTFRSFLGEYLLSQMNAGLLSSPEAWQRAMEKTGISPDAPGADYEGMLRAVKSGHIYFDAPPGYYLKQGALLLEEIDAVLKRKKWGWLVSESGQFIGSDNPITIDGPEGQPIGFQNAGVLFYPVNRHLLLYATPEPIEPPFLTTKLIARHNSFLMMFADEQVYSHRPDFHWLHASGKCRNDWTLFSREDFPPIKRSWGDGTLRP